MSSSNFALFHVLTRSIDIIRKGRWIKTIPVSVCVGFQGHLKCQRVIHSQHNQKLLLTKCFQKRRNYGFMDGARLFSALSKIYFTYYGTNLLRYNEIKALGRKRSVRRVSSLWHTSSGHLKRARIFELTTKKFKKTVKLFSFFVFHIIRTEWSIWYENHSSFHCVIITNRSISLAIVCCWRL